MLRDHIGLLCTQFILATQVVLVRYSTQFINPIVFVVFRHLIGVPLFCIFSQFFRECREYVMPSSMPNLGYIHWPLAYCALLGMLTVTINTTVVAFGVHLAGSITGGIIASTNPMVVCALSLLLRIETTNKWKVLGLAITCGGGCVVIGFDIKHNGSVGEYLLGCLLCGISSVCFSAYLVLQKPILKEGMPPLYMLSRAFVMGALGVFIIAALYNPTAFSPSALATIPFGVWLCLIYSGVFANVVVYWITAVIVKGAHPTIATLYTNTQPFYVAFEAWLLLGESMHWNHFVGILIVCCGVGVTLYGRAQEEHHDGAVAQRGKSVGGDDVDTMGITSEDVELEN